MKLTHGSLFSGIGGFDLAADRMGWDNIFHCEWNEFGKKILNYYWPKAISYHDITKTDFTPHRGKIDILTGGFPCQPYSTAGNRLGDKDERHLWPEMLRAIREIQPRWIVGENVRGIVSWNGGLVFDQVQLDLENEGYQVFPYILPACGINAPHRRERVWFVAYAGSKGYQRGMFRENRFAPGTGENERIQRERIRADIAGIGTTGATSDTNCAGWKEQHVPDFAAKSGFTDRGSDEIGNSNGFDRFPTQSPVCDGDDGLSSRLDNITLSKWRNESIKGGGNAIVPGVAMQLFKTIEKHEALIQASQKPMKAPSTLGGKNGNGTPQNLINHVPEHRTFCTLFARYCGLHKNIRPAKTTIINDLDPDIYKMYRDRYLGNVDVGVFCLDAITILQNKGIGSLSLDLTTTFIYLDPPYLHSTRKNPETNKYKFELTDAQHQALIDAALQFKHAKIMISHYECDLYNQLLAAGWYKHSYMSMTRGGLVQETIYFNYPPPTLLHDYRYIGADFREREALKRVKVNLIKKLDRLEPVLRNSILTDLASHYSAVSDHK